jgi:prophage tail gpP-like protein
VQFDGDANARLKHGRQVIVQNLNPNLKAILPFIQVEIGQSPIELLKLYASREGLLINVGARGELLFFRPNYENQALYAVEFFPSTDANRVNNNVVGTPTLTQDIDGVVSKTDCWSTVVIPPKIQNSENPNEQFRHDFFVPDANPLPFNRLLTFSDQEAISPQLRKNRAKWKWQMGMFQSWTYEIEVQGHSYTFDKSEGGAFYVSNTMISVNDQVNKVQGTYYVQSARRSCMLRDGLRTKLTIRRPGLLNPELEKLGGGAKKAAKIPKAVP